MYGVIRKSCPARCFLPNKTLSCIWVAIPVDWVILHWYACGADGRSGGRSVYGHVITKFFRMVVYHISLPMVLRFARESSAKMSAIFFHNQNNSTSSPGLLGNGALTFSGLHFWLHFLVKHKILPNLAISNWLWWIMRVLLANQNWGNVLNE